MNDLCEACCSDKLCLVHTYVGIYIYIFFAWLSSIYRQTDVQVDEYKAGGKPLPGWRFFRKPRYTVWMYTGNWGFLGCPLLFDTVFRVQCLFEWLYFLSNSGMNDRRNQNSAGFNLFLAGLSSCVPVVVIVVAEPSLVMWCFRFCSGFWFANVSRQRL